MSNTNRTATIIGATGLIGSQLLHLLLNDKEFHHVTIIARRNVHVKHNKLHIAVIDFADQDALRSALAGSDAVFCAVGTTQQKVKGDKTEYRKVDYDIPVNAARLCATEGVRQMLLVSSVGADRNSKNFYLQLKGEVEEAVAQSGVQSVAIFRPSMLMGDRKEFRLGEKIAQTVMKALKWFIPSRYKPITAYDVAKAMIAASKSPATGTIVYHHKEMIHLSKAE
jgi:uncharacterized protein YbjT (DUF2867 family)